jgi:hypothetical protein
VAAQARTNGAVVRAFAPEADRRSDAMESGAAEWALLYVFSSW